MGNAWRTIFAVSHNSYYSLIITQKGNVALHNSYCSLSITQIGNHLTQFPIMCVCGKLATRFRIFTLFVTGLDASTLAHHFMPAFGHCGHLMELDYYVRHPKQFWTIIEYLNVLFFYNMCWLFCNFEEV